MKASRPVVVSVLDEEGGRLRFSQNGTDFVDTKNPTNVGVDIWRLGKVYGQIIGFPELKPHDLRQGVAMEVLEQHHDLVQVRALLGHARIDTTKIYTSIRPSQLKHACVVLRGEGGPDAQPLTKCTCFRFEEQFGCS